MTELTTHTLEVPGAVLTYDVRRNGASTEPPLMLIGEPMGAAGFGTLSGYFTDRTVITYDPRGVERSQRTDGAGQSTREEHADDVHRVIEAVGGPVDLFASSGGAINALALVAQHPEDVRTLVAHEPPMVNLLPDRDAVGCVPRRARDVHAQRLRGRPGALHRHDVSQGTLPGRLVKAARARPSDVRAADGGRRIPRRSAARPGPRL